MRDVKRCQWMSQGKYGMMIHYLIDPVGDNDEDKLKDFNNKVNSFDLDRFMSYVDICDPAWLCITIAQNYGYYIGENAYIDKIIPGITSDRDLITELGKELKKRGKRLLCYLPGEAKYNSDIHPKLISAFKWDDNDPKREAFFKAWEQVFYSYSQKFKDLCDGWWIDGCYDFYTNGFWDFSVWAKALRSGNQNSALAFSDGSFCIDSLYNITDENDYFPGEVTACQGGQIRMDPGIYGLKGMTVEGYAPCKDYIKLYTPDNKYIDGALAHALVPIDTLWCIYFNEDSPWIYYPSKDIIKLIKSFNDVEGAVTINVPVTYEGEIPETTINKLIDIKKAIRG